MTIFITICGALGAWLLVAGPMYQAALELREQEFDHEGFDKTRASVPPPKRVSPWWWLLPPVAWVLQRKAQRIHQDAILAALGPEQLRQAVNFTNKASGWFMVAAGAFLIALFETWGLVEKFGWPWFVWIILCVALFALCILNTVVRIRRGRTMLKEEEPNWRASRGS